METEGRGKDRGWETRDRRWEERGEEKTGDERPKPMTIENIACNAALPRRDDPAGHLTTSPLFCDDDDDDDDK
jgi:hypothetical protein